MNYFQNKIILIIGATGTIGTKLVKELIAYSPKIIRIFSRDEYKQFEMQHSSMIISNNKKNIFRFLIGDVRDFERVDRAMKGVDIVFNLAAMKHVPFCEYNPDEAIKTNVVGMQNVIKAAIKNKVQCVLYTSSDKAINPTNTYGATKMLAEKLVQVVNFNSGYIDTKFIAVRFGNVMGSRGSVIPLFKKQIVERKSITITDLTMNRFMMTCSQAVKLMIKACEVSKGGELFILKMPVINLKDLAEVIIEETCKKLNIDHQKIKMDIIGHRPGERLYEELMTEEESKYSKDLGEMYVVPPSTEQGLVSRYYKEYSDCILKSYASIDEKAMDKEKLKNLLLEEGLL